MNASPSLLFKPMFEPVGHQKFIRCTLLWATAPKMNQVRSPPASSPATPAAERCRPWQPSSRQAGAIYTYLLPRLQWVCATGEIPAFSVATVRYQPHGWKNQPRFLAPDAHVVELRGLGAQCPSLYYHDADQAQFLREIRGPGQAEPRRKTFVVFRLPCTRGRGVESCPVLVASW